MRVHLYKPGRRLSQIGLLLSAAGFLVAVILFWIGFQNTEQGASKEQLLQLEEAVERAIVTCYAVEGKYPPDVAYLEQYYGVRIDHNRYIVDYTTVGSNVRPSVQVVPVGSAGV